MHKKPQEGDMYPVYSAYMASFLCQKRHQIRGFQVDKYDPTKACCLFMWNDRFKEDLDEYNFLRERNNTRGYKRKIAKRRAQELMDKEGESEE